MPSIEIKSSSHPKQEKGFWSGVKFLNPNEKWIIAQVDQAYPGPEGTVVTNLEHFLKSNA